MGEFVLDLTDVEDADQLLGSTVQIDTGWGQTTVIVPDDLNVGLDAQVEAGDIHAFGTRDERHLRRSGPVRRMILTLPR